MFILCVNTRTSMVKTNPFFDVTDFHSCSGHGACDGTDGHCHCDKGWRLGLRKDCNWLTCPAGCRYVKSLLYMLVVLVVYLPVPATL